MYWSDQRSLILKLVLGCSDKLSLGRIKPRHMYLLLPHLCGWSCKGWRVGVKNCVIQLIALLDLRSPSSSSFKTSFVYYWHVCIIFTGSYFIDPGTCFWMLLLIVSGTYPNRNTDLIPSQVCRRLWQGCRFSWLYVSPPIHWMTSRQFLNIFKFEVVYACICPRCTKAHWINTSQLFCECSKALKKVIFVLLSKFW